MITLPCVVECLDAGKTRGWCRSAADALSQTREGIDALNVYPVADGDTGTNLYITMEAVAEAAESSPGENDLATTWRAIARGALLGARGNSGVIVSQMLGGLAEVLPGSRGRALGAGLRRASALAYAAVGRPVEGTVLTVARAAGEAVRDGTEDIAAAARAAADSARAALRRTPEQLDVLARAGVVDAGGAGLCVILDALAGTVSGRAPQPVLPEPARTPAAPAGSVSAGSPRPPRGRPEPREPDQRADQRGRNGRGGATYEVTYLLEAAGDALPGLRARLDELGDSLLVVGGKGLWNVHVHTDDAGAAIEAGVAAGRPHRIRVTCVVTQGAELPVQRAGFRGRGVLAVAVGEGTAHLFTRAGATVLPRDPETTPVVSEMLEAACRAGDEVALLPNQADARPVAEAAALRARGNGCRASVVPTKATVQGLAALAVNDPQRRFDDDVVAMTAAAGATRFGEVTVAPGPAVTSAGICRGGDALGLVEGDVAVIGAEMETVATEVIDRILSGGGELVTLVTGEGAPADLAEVLLTHLRGIRPDVHSTVYTGGHPGYPLLVGVE